LRRCGWGRSEKLPIPSKLIAKSTQQIQAWLDMKSFVLYLFYKSELEMALLGKAMILR
jgi:hypothetical protein